MSLEWGLSCITNIDGVPIEWERDRRNLSVVSIVSGIDASIDRFIMLIDLISSVRSVSDGGRGGNATAVRSHSIDYRDTEASQR